MVFENFDSTQSTSSSYKCVQIFSPLLPIKNHFSLHPSTYIVGNGSMFIGSCPHPDKYYYISVKEDSFSIESRSNDFRIFPHSVVDYFAWLS